MIDDKPLDLTDPAVLACQCAELAPMMEQQEQASRGHSAMAGAPFPGFMFHRTASILRACHAALAKQVQAAELSKPAEVVTDKSQEPKKK